MNKILTIKQLNNYLKGVFEDEIILHDVTVGGEIFEFKVVANNTFLVLKDEDSVLSCYRFGTVEDLKIGAKVKVTGKVTFYPGSGKVSLNIKYIEKDGEGEQRLALLRLRKKLEEEGLCKGRPLPSLIKSLALITSAEGAVLHDFVTVIGETDFKPDIFIYSVRVQGDNAVTTILNALNSANKTNVDLIVMARGGGSQSDLSCFNDESLARAVNASSIPVLSAIGHEIDYSLCDFCAAARAGTPSIAAQIVADINRRAAQSLSELIFDMKTAVKNNFELCFGKVLYRTEKLYRYSVSISGKLKDRVLKCCISLEKHSDLKKQRDSIEKLCSRLSRAEDNIFASANNAFTAETARLDLLSPLKVIGQGYGKVSLSGKEINEVSELSVGNDVNILMRDGSFDAEIKNINRRA